MKLGKVILGVLVMLGSGCVVGHAACTARTPQQALPAGWKVQADHANPLAADAASSRYRLARVVLDPALHRRWAFIENCTHPERPLQVVALTLGARLPNSNTEIGSASQPAAEKPRLVSGHDFSRGVSAERTGRASAPAVCCSVSIQPSPPLQIGQSIPQPFTPISSAMAPLIRAGDLVHLWSSDANVRLEIDVVALEYGHAGQVIHLRRAGQSMLLAGVVVGKDSAELMP